MNCDARSSSFVLSNGIAASFFCEASSTTSPASPRHPGTVENWSVHCRRRLGRPPSPILLERRSTRHTTYAPTHHHHTIFRAAAVFQSSTGTPGGATHTLAEFDRQRWAQIQRHVQEDAEPCSDDPSSFVSGIGHSRRQPTYIPAGVGLAIVVLGRGWGGYGCEGGLHVQEATRRQILVDSLQC